jgi:hypothetical protein
MSTHRANVRTAGSSGTKASRAADLSASTYTARAATCRTCRDPEQLSGDAPDPARKELTGKRCQPRSNLSGARSLSPPSAEPLERSLRSAARD